MGGHLSQPEPKTDNFFSSFPPLCCDDFCRLTPFKQVGNPWYVQPRSLSNLVVTERTVPFWVKPFFYACWKGRLQSSMYRYHEQWTGFLWVLLSWTSIPVKITLVFPIDVRVRAYCLIYRPDRRKPAAIIMLSIISTKTFAGKFKENNPFRRFFKSTKLLLDITGSWEWGVFCG